MYILIGEKKGHRMSQYKPPFSITDTIHRLKSQIIKYERSIKEGVHATAQMLHSANICSVHSTLAIENILLTPTQVTEIIDGQYVPCTPNEIRAVKNAYEAYHLLDIYHPPDPYSPINMLHLHRVFMTGLTKEAGCFRSGEAVGTGQKRGNTAPSAKLVPRHLDNLIDWVKTSDEHPLIKSCVFHYEFMSIQPFSVGNGYVARLWHILLLYHWVMPMGLPLADIICSRKQDYFDTLAIPDKAVGATKFIEYMLQAIKGAAVEYDKRGLSR
ncbi:MAG: Fic family protein [Defluviitaleaceae bacterium]|nr:Fic family protein [Defluviitaleaceae bacterium]